MDVLNLNLTLYCYISLMYITTFDKGNKFRSNKQVHETRAVESEAWPLTTCSRMSSDKQCSLAYVVAHCGSNSPLANLPPPTPPHPIKPLQQPILDQLSNLAYLRIRYVQRKKSSCREIKFKRIHLKNVFFSIILDIQITMNTLSGYML